MDSLILLNGVATFLGALVQTLHGGPLTTNFTTLFSAGLILGK